MDQKGEIQNQKRDKFLIYIKRKSNFSHIKVILKII